ncbi:MAG TPA: CPCC family cysteine-rich protein [Dehalococcoidia bacterium]|nr:CPCC family cysteine-rich protein [Dehalococcoidia bacterium]
MYLCPCCHQLTLDEQPPDTYDICPVCDWEDDGVQLFDPDYAPGANMWTLNEVRAARRLPPLKSSRVRRR